MSKSLRLFETVLNVKTEESDGKLAMLINMWSCCLSLTHTQTRTHAHTHTPYVVNLTTGQFWSLQTWAGSTFPAVELPELQVAETLTSQTESFPLCVHVDVFSSPKG